MGPRESWPGSYPLTYARGDAAPILLLHGGRDRTVNPTNAARLSAAIRARGGCASYRVYRGIDHIGIVIALSVPRFHLAPVMDDLLGFIRDPRGVACSR
jgi:acetyl esterase/lipase